MQVQQLTLQTENEKLKRQVFTKEKLLSAQEESNKGYIETIRQQYKKIEEGYKGQIAEHRMQYEDIRTLCSLHWENIQRLEDRVFELEMALKEMTTKKETLERLLAEKELELIDVWDKFEKKSFQYIEEVQAHRL